MESTFAELLEQVRACRLCAHELEPRPVLRLSPESRVLLMGQAPGSKVHASGVPWQDASGDHLLEWLGISREVFEDPDNFGILPMAFCYPGRGRSGDLPPPPRCAQTWHAPLMERLHGPRLTLLVGQYAQRAVLGPRRRRTLTETVAAWRDYLPRELPLPHPSWRSRRWMAQNPWFGQELLPVLREQIALALAPGPPGSARSGHPGATLPGAAQE